MTDVNGKSLNELAYNDYLSGMKYKDIALKYGVSLNTVKSWKVRYKWDKKSVHTNEKVCTQKKSAQKKDAPKEDIDKKIIAAAECNEELNDKQRLFCIAYVKNFNAEMASIRAGYHRDYGWQLLREKSVREEIQRLKQIKSEALMVGEDDIVDRYMRIAFADMTDFVEFGQETVPVMSMFGPLMEVDPITGHNVPVTKVVNTVKFKQDSQVDGGLICQIKQGKDGATLKLEDRQKALEWLANFFNMDPMNKHKQDYDKRRLAIEKKKAEITAEEQRARIAVLKTKVDNGENAQDINDQITALADLINKPVPDRVIDDD